VNLTSTTDGVQIQYEAFDPEGDLYNIVLNAEYGHGNTVPIYADSYPAHASPSHVWQGVTSDIRPASPAVFVPPTSCAYLFQVTAYSRTTNGYQYPVNYATDFQTVTIQKPGLILRPLPLTGPELLTPAGFAKLPDTGVTRRTPVKVLSVPK